MRVQAPMPCGPCTTRNSEGEFSPCVLTDFLAAARNTFTYMNNAAFLASPVLHLTCTYMYHVFCASSKKLQLCSRRIIGTSAQIAPVTPSCLGTAAYIICMYAVDPTLSPCGKLSGEGLEIIPKKDHSHWEKGTFTLSSHCVP